jgi:hypothetical protein
MHGMDASPVMVPTQKKINTSTSTSASTSASKSTNTTPIARATTYLQHELVVRLLNNLLLGNDATLVSCRLQARNTNARK